MLQADALGRLPRKLRLSLLDACDLRCRYCMPERPKFSLVGGQPEMAPLLERLRVLVAAGVNQIRVTGGEPTLHPLFMAWMEALAGLSPAKLALTSHGLHLKPHLRELLGLGCRHLNLSLDALDSATFERITGHAGVERVVDTLLEAQALGFEVRVNTVVMAGVNDHQLEDFVAFAIRHGINLRFLEVMNIGAARAHFADWFIPAAALRERLARRWELAPLSGEADATANNYRVENTHIGFIASESEPFCRSCTRLRLDTRGVLRPCLFAQEGVSLMDVPPEEVVARVNRTFARKPDHRLPSQPVPMYRLGG